MTEPPASSPSQQRSTPVPLRVAAALAALEGVLVVGYAAAGLFSLTRSTAAPALASVLFFVVYGVALVYFAWALNRLKSWARSPIVLAQLIEVLIVWDFRGGVGTALTVGVTLAGVAVLVGIFHPASLRALARD